MTTNSPDGDPAHRLSPAGTLLWRSSSSIQIEVGAHRLVVDGVTGESVRELLSESASAPEPGSTVDRLRVHLSRRGYLWPTDEDFTPPVPRLAPELTALAARFGQDAADLLRARGRRSVVVQGNGRTGSLTAALLAAAGVGRVHLLDRGPARLVHAIPGGVRPSDEGRPLAEAAAACVNAAAPEVNASPPPLGQPPDLVILAVDEPVDSDVRDGLHAREAAHLPISVTPAGGTVGPLVLPGLSSCLACTDLQRRDRDEAWPALAVQLSMPPRYPRSGEVAVCAAISGIAAGQALAFLDGEMPTTLEASLELRPPDWRVRRRSWPAHPDCGCMS